MVDRYTKFAHFILLTHLYTTFTLVQLFMKHIFKLHGMTNFIIFERNKTFTSKFWGEIFKQQGEQLEFSISYHLHTDGQLEAVNKTLKNCLRCFLGDRPKD